MNGQNSRIDAAFIAIGSNINPERHIPRSIRSIRSLGRIVRVGGCYRNNAVGSPELPGFVNTALLLETELRPMLLKTRLRGIENELGRRRTPDRFASRIIDLDLCLYGIRVIQTAELTLPDPDLLRYAHIALPVSDLDPDFPHPVTCEPLRMIAMKLAPHNLLTSCPEIEAEVQEMLLD
ncbi:2-amino-4-hydroxy-6-hydroxymethyldihydropteridine diphosphokinase [bacterium]|nr:2-amino-4-hydroxy-6-hydroxymethyldihydropteridine diphosphokinase [candidate division CSSED10-310 bacterium]